MRSNLVRLSAAFLLAVASSASLAQVRANLPGSIVESASIGGPERQQIAAFVDALSADATGADEDAANRARAALVAPMRDHRASVAFRQAFASASLETIRRLTGSEDPGARIAGLRLAGALATADTTALITGALGDADEGVRVYAAAEARRVFETTAANGPAMTESQATALVTALADALDDAGGPFRQSLIRALGAAAQMDVRELANTRQSALVSLCNAVGSIVREMDNADLTTHRDTILLATTAATRALSQVGAAVPDSGAKAGAELGGEVLAVILQRDIQGANAQDKTEDVRLTRAAESLVYFARRRAIENARGDASTVPQTDLAGLLEKGDRAFRRELLALIGPGSAMLAQFQLPDNRFVK